MNSNEDESDNQVDCDEDTLCKYGSQLPQFEIDEIPSKKPVHVEDMIVKDENGRRRFHGAFTGGFSAGFWNTVGSKEGFTPSEFKSSRNEKMFLKQMKPSDFMDEEDFSEFGIAPQKIQTKDDFEANSSNSNKRKRELISDGPIPGEPVLVNLLKPIRDKAAVRILKTMGWRENQGIGSRVTYREKKQRNEQNKREMYISQKYADKEDSEDEEMSDDEEITFAPDDFDPFIAEIKQNTFGLGYSGLRASTSALSTTSQSRHVDLFQSFQVVDRKNRKFSIRGQAFGVGALEEEDDDIYAIDDMSNYDRMLESEKEKNKKPLRDKPFDASIIEGFVRATINDSKIEVFRVDVPRDFVPRNFLERKSRFAPIDEIKAKEIELQKKHKLLGLGRHDLKPDERGALINESKIESKSNIEEQKQESARKIAELLNSKQFISEHSKKNENFKPFAGYPEKQERYEKFLALKSNDEKEIDKLLNDIQPLSMSSFDREMEKKEFIQAKRMYQPLDSLMANRFIKEADVYKEQQQQVQKKNDNGKEVVVIQRSKSMWKPHKLLCKLFNIPEPYGGMMFDEEEEQKNKKKQSSSSLFDYIGVPLNTKSNFVTPQIIPRKITDDNRKQHEEEERRKSFLNAIEKEKSFMNNRAAAKDFFDTKEPLTSRKIIKEPEKPKTELEIKVIESIDKKPEEKQDLFKAIFCDSDDDDDATQTEQNESKISVNEENSSLSEQQKSTFIKSFLSTKTAGEINVLRNASPPRGIFKNIFEMATTQKSSSKEKVTEINEEDAAYGPALPTLPTNISTTVSKDNESNDSSSSSDSSLDEKLLKKLKKMKSREKWVEKDKVHKSKKKKKKSHKKSSHKKHKSKR
ncbi:hypothetical protein PVAND_005931 [Polypedilum vanderplanki]|uniref:G-patch domain-containing protein n=1 Tax=Polypedilum vanderplanki TaxID=319348 RepID=A0A9J6C2H6_POLVA|nr:hypothetical protein PVAND_005931 [Polypedilum vanderplanki]